MRRLARAVVVAIVVVAGALAAAMAFGGPAGRLPPVQPTNPFAAVDVSTLPAAELDAARGGHAAYIGQLEDFGRALPMAAPKTLVGFSAGPAAAAAP